MPVCSSNSVMRDSSIYSPHEQTFTTRSLRAAVPVTINVASSTQARPPAAIFFPRPGYFFGGFTGAGASARAGRRTWSWLWWFSRMLMRASSRITVTNSSVDTALISGLTRFFVMP